MGRRYSLLLILLLPILLQNSLHAQASLPASPCPQIDDDERAVNTDDFNIPLHPGTPSSESRGRIYPNGRVFRLKYVREKFVPLLVFGLAELKRLEVDRTCFEPCEALTIPSHIQCLALSLTELSISNTRIISLPNEIGRLINLQVLKLSNTGLVHLPDAIGHLSSLAMLYLPNNDLQTLPKSMKNLRSLRQLTLYKNPKLHSLQAIETLPSLRTLDARHCSIETLPQDLPILTNLYMTNNSLTTIVGIQTLGYRTSDAKSFYFSHNFIRYATPRLEQVTNLSRLHLNNNQLRHLPLTICNITTLRSLQIQSNRFDEIQFKKKCKEINPQISFE